MIELYHHWQSVCAIKVRLALEEKGIAWESHFVDLHAGEQFKPDYVKLNPKSVVPTLVHDGRVLVESTVICEYLDDAFPAPALRPAAPLERARMRLWTKLVDEELHTACVAVTFIMLHRDRYLERPPAEIQALIDAIPDADQRARRRRYVFDGFAGPDLGAAARAYEGTLARMEEALAEAPWLAGAGYSLADVAVTPYVNRLFLLGLEEMWQGARPRVAAWFERVRERPNFAGAFHRFVGADEAADVRARAAANVERFHALRRAL